MKEDYRIYTSTGEINGQSYTSVGMVAEPTPVTMSQRVHELTRAVKELKDEVKGIGAVLFLMMAMHAAVLLVVMLNLIFK